MLVGRAPRAAAIAAVLLAAVPAIDLVATTPEPVSPAPGPANAGPAERGEPPAPAPGGVAARVPPGRRAVTILPTVAPPPIEVGHHVELWEVGDAGLATAGWPDPDPLAPPTRDAPSGTAARRPVASHALVVHRDGDAITVAVDAGEVADVTRALGGGGIAVVLVPEG